MKKHDVQLIEEIKSIFENNGVNVTMVEAPSFTVDGNLYEMKSQRCSENWRDDIKTFITEYNIKKYFLYTAENIVFNLDGKLTQTPYFRGLQYE